MFANKTHKKADEVFKSGDLKRSILLYSKALKESPNDCNILSDRGVAYIHAKEKEKSIDDFNRAIELQPNYGYRYAARAFAKNHFGDIDEAIIDYKKAVILDPKDAIGQNNLGLLLEKKGYQKEANNHFKLADKISKKESEYSYSNDADNKTNSNIRFKKNTYKEISIKSEFKKLFTSKTQLKEFITFLQNGFKIK